MATLDLQDIPVTGLANVVFIAATGAGDEIITGPGAILLIRNDDAAGKMITIDTPITVRGLEVENPTITVAAGDFGAFTVIRNVFGRSAQITYDAVTNLFVAAIRFVG